MPTIRPSAMMRYQSSPPAASTATSRARPCGISLRCSSPDHLRKRSTQGIDTRRTLSDLSRYGSACCAVDTSLPVAMTTRSGSSTSLSGYAPRSAWRTFAGALRCRTGSVCRASASVLAHAEVDVAPRVVAGLHVAAVLHVGEGGGVQIGRPADQPWNQLRGFLQHGLAVLAGGLGRVGGDQAGHELLGEVRRDLPSCHRIPQLRLLGIGPLPVGESALPLLV